MQENNGQSSIEALRRAQEAIARIQKENFLSNSDPEPKPEPEDEEKDGEGQEAPEESGTDSSDLSHEGLIQLPVEEPEEGGEETSADEESGDVVETGTGTTDTVEPAASEPENQEASEPVQPEGEETPKTDDMAVEPVVLDVDAEPEEQGIAQETAADPSEDFDLDSMRSFVEETASILEDQTALSADVTADGVQTQPGSVTEGDYAGTFDTQPSDLFDFLSSPEGNATSAAPEVVVIDVPQVAPEVVQAPAVEAAPVFTATSYVPETATNAPAIAEPVVMAEDQVAPAVPSQTTGTEMYGSVSEIASGSFDDVLASIEKEQGEQPEFYAPDPAEDTGFAAEGDADDEYEYVSIGEAVGPTAKRIQNFISEYYVFFVCVVLALLGIVIINVGTSLPAFFIILAFAAIAALLIYAIYSAWKTKKKAELSYERAKIIYESVHKHMVDEIEDQSPDE